MAYLDHVSLGVRDMKASIAFYDAVLAPLDIKRVKDFEEAEYAASGYGAGLEPEFWIGADTDGKKPLPSEGTHVAFRARTRGAVDAFHGAGLKTGGRDNGAPGIRAHYHPNYYAAFLLDPDGHHIEAVCHAPGEFADQFKS